MDTIGLVQLVLTGWLQWLKFHSDKCNPKGAGASFPAVQSLMQTPEPEVQSEQLLLSEINKNMSTSCGAFRCQQLSEGLLTWSLQEHSLLKGHYEPHLSLSSHVHICKHTHVHTHKHSANRKDRCCEPQVTLRTRQTLNKHLQKRTPGLLGTVLLTGWVLVLTQFRIKLQLLQVSRFVC